LEGNKISDGRFFKNKNSINVKLSLRHIAKVEMVEVVKCLEIIEGRRPKVRVSLVS